MKEICKNFFNPFVKIAGTRALAWGLGGLAISAAAAAASGLHANHLLQFGPAARDGVMVSALEYLIIWLVPAAVFYGMGAALSRSRIRVVDVLGTTAFALLPLVAMNLWQLVPGVKELMTALAGLAADAAGAAGAGAADDPTVFVQQATSIMTRPLFIFNMLVTLAVVVLMLVWLFGAVKVSCNLRGGRLWATWLVGVIGGGVILSGLAIGLLR